ncbi:SAM-dependent methyltransferase [Rhodococcus sp. 05-2255-1e]|uniref:class I SAM-dependent methyltransferase n=1 Tax=Rhodococcus sp. 05-2255-1e TaxID=2022495 RepID=UPI000B9BA7E8|nr:class I SAM-dependent methyltransferase [Rhodococcus sp. 05-2255-1e]OZE28285.1 SAM-dependent methyltransferase [Rhodococcus sp. 05-2255-1e]
MTPPQDLWNHNIHYYDLALRAAPTTTRTALDVGTGDGLLAIRLAERFSDVTGIDSDRDIIAHAQSGTTADVTWIVGDVLTYDLPSAHYDLVVAVATVHHFPDLARGLRRLAYLTSPGGVMVALGCARSASVLDYVFEALGTVQHQVLVRTRGYWQHNAPVRTELPHTYDQVKAIAAETLPGMRWRRLPLWRYSLTWHKPR